VTKIKSTSLFLNFFGCRCDAPFITCKSRDEKGTDREGIISEQGIPEIQKTNIFCYYSATFLTAEVAEHSFFFFSLKGFSLR